MRHSAGRACNPLAHHVVSLLGALAALAWPVVAQAVGPGQWTPKFDWASTDPSDRRTAIHMMLLRGDGAPYHSRVMWFGGEPIAVFKGGIWGWNPWVDSCASYPDTNFTEITPPNVGYNVFCSGHSGLADGRMFVAGGNSDVTGAFGVTDATIHTAGTGTAPGAWNAVGDMSAWRWYPTNTTLKDGRVLVTAGYQHRQHRKFGGRLGGSAPASPSGDTLRRWAPIEGGAWDPPVLPEEDATSTPVRPHPREGHTGVDLTGIANFSNQTLFFGGKRTDGIALNDLWALKREDNITGADYQYKWERKTPGGTGPSERSEHSAVVANGTVLVFGGRATDGTAVENNVYRYTPGAEGTWEQIEIDSGGPPSARMGHVAIYNEMALRELDVDKYVRRMIIYGGVATEGDTPTDNNVYELRFNPANPTHGHWKTMPETTFSFSGFPGPAQFKPPAPRYWHRAVAANDSLTLAGGAPRADLAYVFGGARGGGAYTDSLWMLCLFASGKFGWVHRNVGGTRPSPRARFSLAFDATQGQSNGPRLYVHGGEGAAGLADPGLYRIDPYVFAPPEIGWQKWGEAGYSASGHVAVCEGKETHSRVGEIFDPAAGGSWTTLTGAPLLEQSYPVTFTVSGGSSAGGRVVTASSVDDVARYADLPGPGSSATTWQPFPNGALGFSGETGVLYRPNKLLIAGGLSGGTVVGTSKTLDASNTSNAWVATATMQPRAFHNLVLLPDGKVLATGGATTTANYNAHPVREPQIWDPNGGGTWTAPASLDTSTAVRGYHSTSILLPDARVLCAGGWGEGAPFHADQFRADIYCPPYLFNFDGSFANRPAIHSAPTTVTYSERFTVCLASDSVTLGSVALLRSAMTTHGFDQNQRYVPLAWSLGSTTPGVERTYTVDAPWDRSQAPPGDYLLFVVNGAGTPGIARWIRLVDPSPDTAHPQRVLSLQKVCSYGESVDLKWNPPAGDSLPGACPGPVHSYQLRYSTSPLDPYVNFPNGTLADTPALPGLPGSSNWDLATIGGLTPNTRYYFRLVSKDYAGANSNWSAMSNALSFVTHYEECGGFGGGGGEGGGGRSARRVAGGTGLRRGGAATGTAYEENTLLANVPAGVSRSDLLHLPGGPLWTAAGARVRLARTGTRGTHVERVRLLAVDPPPGTRAFARGGEVVVGTLAAAASVAHVDGRDLSASLADGNAFAGADDDTVKAAFAASGPGSIVLSTAGAHLVLPPSETGIEVQSRVDGGWLTVARHHPRALGGDEVIDVPELAAIRLIFHGEHTLLGVERFEGASASSIAIAEPVTVSHSNSGAGVAQLVNGGITLGPGEQLFTDFAASPPGDGVQRSWFLDVRGAHMAATPGGAVAKRSPPTEPGAPARFALHQNRPNPFARSTRIHFDVPVTAHVELAIFDLLGRRVAGVADRRFEPGRHFIDWDRRGAHGREVPAGVYLYRLRTPQFREQRTMVLVP